MSQPRAKYKDGSSYRPNEQYMGRGVLRSCDRCGEHVHPASLKKWRGLLVACPKCRG